MIFILLYISYFAFLFMGLCSQVTLIVEEIYGLSAQINYIVRETPLYPYNIMHAYMHIHSFRTASVSKVNILLSNSEKGEIDS